jgi:hypothetical protein
VSEYESEPVPGLPEVLPQDETLLWQGSPKGWSVARHGLFAASVAGYFALLSAAVVIAALMDGVAPLEALGRSSHMVVIGAAAVLIVAYIGHLIERTTLYTLTSRRVVMRVGIALPLTLNIPFTKIASASVKTYADGTSDIALLPAETLPVTFFHIWPHVRGFRMRHPEPTLRAIAGGEKVAGMLVNAMLAAGVKGETRPLAATMTGPVSDGHAAPIGAVAA